MEYNGGTNGEELQWVGVMCVGRKWEGSGKWEAVLGDCVPGKDVVNDNWVVYFSQLPVFLFPVFLVFFGEARKKRACVWHGDRGEDRWGYRDTGMQSICRGDAAFAIATR